MEMIGEARSYVVEILNFVIFLFIWHFLGEFRFLFVYRESLTENVEEIKEN